MKPFLKWVGGKRQLLSELQALLPVELATTEKFDYFEPFVGGGAMLFFMLRNYPNLRRVVVNDINKDLIGSYIAVRDHCEELIARLEELQTHYYALNETERADFFYLLRDNFNKATTCDITERATLMIFLNHTCFNGLYRVNTKGKFNVPFGKYKNPLICDTDTLRADSIGLQRVEFLNGDFSEIEPLVTEKAFVYLDPPYRPLNRTSSFTAYSVDGFDDKDQLRLRDFCMTLCNRGCLIMQSNSDAKAKDNNDWDFDTIYENFIIDRVYASRAINAQKEKRGKLAEIVVRNYV